MKAINVNKDHKYSLSWAASEELAPLEALEVRIRVHAAGVNRADLLQRAGKYPPPPGASQILGLEVAGVVEATGKGVTYLAKGDRVCALLAGGGYASAVNVHEALVLKLPESVDFIEGAAIPEAYLTAFCNLFIEGGLKAGEQVLIHGGGSGIGLAAVQLAARVAARVFVTAGTDQKIKTAKKLGATAGYNYKSQDFAAELKKGVDLILDINGAGYFEQNIRILKNCGRLVIIALMGGAEAKVDLKKLLSKKLTVKGSTLRSRSVEEKGTLKDQFMRHFWSEIEKGTLRPLIDSVFPIEEVEQAHQKMKDNLNIGKIVLTVE
jgi:putative PIG3 family NAD(P)H quinone oxidoreductase